MQIRKKMTEELPGEDFGDSNSPQPRKYMENLTNKGGILRNSDAFLYHLSLLYFAREPHFHMAGHILV